MKVIQQLMLGLSAFLLVLPATASARVAESKISDTSSMMLEATTEKLNAPNIDKKCRKRGCDPENPHRS